MERNRMTITLAGQGFRITAADDEAYIRSLEKDINERIRRIKARFPRENISRCTLLAMLEMEDDIKKLEAGKRETAETADQLRTVPVKHPFERKKPVGV